MKTSFETQVSRMGLIGNLVDINIFIMNQIKSNQIFISRRLKFIQYKYHIEKYNPRDERTSRCGGRKYK